MRSLNKGYSTRFVTPPYTCSARCCFGELLLDVRVVVVVVVVVEAIAVEDTHGCRVVRAAILMVIVAAILQAHVLVLVIPGSFCRSGSSHNSRQVRILSCISSDFDGFPKFLPGCHNSRYHCAGRSAGR